MPVDPRLIAEEMPMPYAVFDDDLKLSRAFPSKPEALRKAGEAGLVENDAHGKPVLENELTIKPCSPDRETRSNDELDWSLADPGSSENGDIQGMNGERK
jgi:hypothetical protein